MWYEKCVTMLISTWQIFCKLTIIGMFTSNCTSQSVPITTKVVSLNPAHGELYSIQHYVIKFISELQHVGGFLRVLRFPPQYNRNLVKSGVKHHNPDHSPSYCFRCYTVLKNMFSVRKSIYSITCIKKDYAICKTIIRNTSYLVLNNWYFPFWKLHVLFFYISDKIKKFNQLLNSSL